MNNKILGLHHITAITDSAKRNVEFYTNVLGLRMVKKTVNFDDPNTYHFYFGDEVGTPGSILTFFPWEGIGRGTAGSGMATAIGYSVPQGSLDFWIERFNKFDVPHGNITSSFGEKMLPFEDPDGLKINFIESKSADNRKPWETAEVKASHATRGFHSIVLTVKNITTTAEILTGVFGYAFSKQEGNSYRYTTDAIEHAAIVILVEAPKLARGNHAAGTNHHVAFRVKDEDVLMEYREKILQRGLNITQKINRDYFFSLYFREPGGVLFELATENPGFATDETVAELGTSLQLPAQYEAYREKIEATLPKLD
ncbi:ring-cleaving dioxygenase [Lacibacter sediminis]|uniref:Ring-cleaving dioxygenase n=1 Tax=Lacibacter sediminis TaxID=2760713 RepID=A0A7G5XK78_9BACT|nr:ring-cleaving dioxygenase [Lacibacter sediminis]QNA45881.1 ring-cleaving dioxygenase [Lacibacter sediminis]